MKNNENKVIKGHQGDVQYMSIDSLPADAKRIDKKPVALGEHSGHQHVVTGDYEMFEDEKSNIFITVGNAGAVLQHIHESNFKSFDTKALIGKADHNACTKTLVPGKVYKFGIHQRYEPFKKVFEKVQD